MTTPDPWYTDGLCFSCTHCGNCCSGAPGYVWVAYQEITAIARALGLTTEQFETHHTRRVGSRQSLLEFDNGDCEFLERDPDGKARCKIYAVRPLQCRTWPLWESNLRSPRSWKQAARNCPGIGHGARHLLPVIQAVLRANASVSLPL